MDRFRWMMPRPPWRAMATAILASVTVSIGELSSGTLAQIRLETREDVSTSAGMISLCAGWSRTSSKVRPSVSNGSGTPVAVRSEGNDNCSPFDVSMEITCYPAQLARPVIRRHLVVWPDCAYQASETLSLKASWLTETG